MPVSHASVSNDGSRRSVRQERILVVSPSWLGDSIMLMPAILRLHCQAGPLHVAVLAKPAVAPLWRMCPAVDEVIEFKTGLRGMKATVNAIKRGQFDFAYVVPNSFRSALIPFLARIPGRRGFSGHQRRWMLTECVDGKTVAGGHQSNEGFVLFGVVADRDWAGPLLRAGERDCEVIAKRLYANGEEAKRWVAMFPGAARGPGKCWPEQRFEEVGRRLVEQGCRVVLLGAGSDRESCKRIAAHIGRGAMAMAGETSLAELAALLSLCRVVVANDSGGMHLAAAVGTKVVALFGATDPAVTGPIGEGHAVLMAPGIQRGRDIARNSAAGKAALDAITADSVYDAVLRVL